jgi:hypothetical protein
LRRAIPSALALIATLSAQTASIHGTVTDNNHKPLAAVWVTAIRTGLPPLGAGFIPFYLLLQFRIGGTAR